MKWQSRQPDLCFMRIALNWSRRFCGEGMILMWMRQTRSRFLQPVAAVPPDRSIPLRRNRWWNGTVRAARPCGRIRQEVCAIGYFAMIYAKDLPHRAKTVYMYLKDRCNHDNQCYPAIGTIARELQLSRRTVERAIADLEQAGLLVKEQRWRENGGRSSLLYTLKVPP